MSKLQRLPINARAGRASQYPCLPPLLPLNQQAGQTKAGEGIDRRHKVASLACLSSQGALYTYFVSATSFPSRALLYHGSCSTSTPVLWTMVALRRTGRGGGGRYGTLVSGKREWYVG